MRLLKTTAWQATADRHAYFFAHPWSSEQTVSLGLAEIEMVNDQYQRNKSQKNHLDHKLHCPFCHFVTFSNIRVHFVIRDSRPVSTIWKKQ